MKRLKYEHREALEGLQAQLQELQAKVLKLEAITSHMNQSNLRLQEDLSQLYHHVNPATIYNNGGGGTQLSLITDPSGSVIIERKREVKS